jgi:hypothetical protein
MTSSRIVESVVEHRESLQLLGPVHSANPNSMKPLAFRSKLVVQALASSGSRDQNLPYRLAEGLDAAYCLF